MNEKLIRGIVKEFVGNMKSFRLSEKNSIGHIALVLNHVLKKYGVIEKMANLSRSKYDIIGMWF
jgi:hypothetical protein